MRGPCPACAKVAICAWRILVRKGMCDALNVLVGFVPSFFVQRQAGIRHSGLQDMRGSHVRVLRGGKRFACVWGMWSRGRQRRLVIVETPRGGWNGRSKRSVRRLLLLTCQSCEVLALWGSVIRVWARWSPRPCRSKVISVPTPRCRTPAPFSASIVPLPKNHNLSATEQSIWEDTKETNVLCSRSEGEIPRVRR